MTLRDVHPVGYYPDDHERTWDLPEEAFHNRRSIIVIGKCRVRGCQRELAAGPVLREAKRKIAIERFILGARHEYECEFVRLWHPADIPRPLLDFREVPFNGERPWPVEYLDGKPSVKSSRTSKRRRLCPGSGHLSIRAEVLPSWSRDKDGMPRLDLGGCTAAFSCGVCCRHDLPFYLDGEARARWADHFYDP